MTSGTISPRDRAVAATAELCRRNLHDFCEQAWPIIEPAIPFRTGWLVHAMCRHLEAVARGQIENLLVNVPPGCFKSSLSSVFFPAWVWTWAPSTRLFFASYASALSVRDSIRTRNIINSRWYKERFRVELKADQDQKTRFENTAAGWRLASSVGGAATGEHPDIVICDDPHNVKMAESDKERESAINWWSGAIGMRGATRGVRKVVVMQRLHQEDLSGYILANEPDLWDHLCLPMEWEPDRMRPTRIGWTDPRHRRGELVWPELYPQPLVERSKRTLGSLRAAGQLQQRPAPAGGLIFQEPWFGFVNALPAGTTQYVRYWDKAASEGEGDYSAGVLMAQAGQMYYVLDVRRGQWTSLQRNKLIRATAELDRAMYGPGVVTWVEQEGGSGGKESAEITIRELAGFAIRAERVTGTKWDRALPLSAQAEAGNVAILLRDGRRPTWVRDWLDELTSFPNGSNDDQVDGSSGAFNKLAIRRMPDKITGKPAEKREVESRPGIPLDRPGRRPFFGSPNR